MERALATTRPPSGTASPLRRPIRLMIVDDSMVARAVLSRMVETDGAFEIAAVAGTAEDAIDALQYVRVDVILLDLEMPGAGGLSTLPRIIEAARGARVMIVSSLADDGAEETIAALAMGAADTLPKPGTGRFNGKFSEVLVGKLRALGHVEHAGPRIPEPLRKVFEAPLRAMSPDPVELLAIGASTGGIHALGCLFQAMPPRIGIPILVTQHLPAPFMTVFARQLGVAAKREALVAEDGMALLPDRIVIAPGDAHLKVDLTHGQLVARLDRKRSASGCLPSVDPMFASSAAALGSAVMGIVLTGMGRDGVEGATKLVACGGSVMAQDEASCAVFGMPRAVAEAGLVCAVMPPEKLARRIASRAGEPKWK